MLDKLKEYVVVFILIGIPFIIIGCLIFIGTHLGVWLGRAIFYMGF